LYRYTTGARVAMRMCADYPDEIRVCVIEDMDAIPRGPEMSSKFDYPSLRAFDPVGRVVHSRASLDWLRGTYWLS
jgi:hypothetical protein